MEEQLQHELEQIKQSNLYRKLGYFNPDASSAENSDGKPVINFASNNYLGLAQDRRIIQAAHEALDVYGAGSGASRLICGTTPIHLELEQQLAIFKGQEASLVFPTGFMANIGVITSLMDGKDDLIIADRLIHASLVDACRASQALFRVYPHGDVDALSKILQRYPAKRRTMVITDGVFSMDGDIAPLKELCNLAKLHNAWVMVDDAHGTGVLGMHGKGTAEYCNVEQDVHIHMGTLSKACGGLGGFIAGSGELIELVINKARSFIYTTGIAPSVCGAGIEALKIIKSEPWRRERLKNLSKYVRNELSLAGFTVLDGITPIIPVLLGNSELAMKYAQYLGEHGLLVPGIRYPTVHRGQERLRICLQATHSDQEIKCLLDCMREAANLMGTGISLSADTERKG